MGCNALLPRDEVLSFAFVAFYVLSTIFTLNSFVTKYLSLNQYICKAGNFLSLKVCSNVRFILMV